MKPTAILRPPVALRPLAAFTCIALIFCAAAEARGQSATTGAKKTVAGVVHRFTYDIHDGTVNGVVLRQGNIIRWWPYLSKRFTTGIALGDPIQATGRVVTIDRGPTVLWADSVTNLKSKKTMIDNNDPLYVPPPPRLTSTSRVAAPVRRPTTSRSVTIKGTVRRLTVAADGNINGMVLKGGTLVRWPERLGDEFTEMVGTGSRVIVIGRPITTTADGAAVLQAEAVTNERTNATRSIGPAGERTLSTAPARAVVGTTSAVPAQPSSKPEKLVFGTVRRFRTAPSGQVEGVILTDGTDVRWPESMAKAYGELLNKGDRVEVTGRTVDLPGGNIVLEATAINNLNTKTRVVTVAAPPPPAARPAAPPAPDSSVQVKELERRIRSLEGKIDRLTKAVEASRQQQQPQQPQRQPQ